MLLLQFSCLLPLHLGFKVALRHEIAIKIFKAFSESRLLETSGITDETNFLFSLTKERRIQICVVYNHVYYKMNKKQTQKTHIGDFCILSLHTC